MINEDFYSLLTFLLHRPEKYLIPVLMRVGAVVFTGCYRSAPHTCNPMIDVQGGPFSTLELIGIPG